MLIKHVIN